MIVKTRDLDGIALDWAVARCEGRTVKLDPMGFGSSVPDGGPWIWENSESGHLKSCYWRIGAGYSPSTIWAQGGPIIQRDRINVVYSDPCKRWEAWYTVDGNPIHQYDGATPLVAAMRAYVGFTLGGEVDIPEELA